MITESAAPRAATLNILDFGVKDKPFRQVQVDVLEWFAENYDNYDVFVIEAPTATGKSLIVVTIAQFLAALQKSTSVITPTKMLQDQYLRDFEDIPVLKGMSAYPCPAASIDGTCRDTKRHLGSCCKPASEGDIPVCNYLFARGVASAATTALFNFHSYYANKMYKSVLIADEAHNAINFLLEFYSLKLWKCEVGYEDDVELTGAGVKGLVAKTIASLQLYLIDLESDGNGKEAEKVEEDIERLSYIRDSIERFGGELLIEKVKDAYHGKVKELRKTEQEYIYVKPLRVDRIGEDFLWPKSVEKVVLLSATINDIDVARLGLNVGRKATIYRCNSPIPPERRPFMITPVASMKYANRNFGTPKIIKAIQVLAAHHKDQKGVVHCTYDMAKKIQAEVGGDPRYWFHDKYNKSEVYNKFRASKGNAIFVASGMEEGIDLAFDAGRWQVITQLMRPNVTDRVNSWMYRNNRRVYNWEAVRKIIQQTGRICRDPTDFGVTYMLDSEFEAFYTESFSLWPQWFRDAMRTLSLDVA